MVKRKYGEMSKSAGKADAVKSNGNASVCVNCSKCLEKCPQHIQIPSELKKVHKVLGENKRLSDLYG